jgi:hypothetical protein
MLYGISMDAFTLDSGTLSFQAKAKRAVLVLNMFQVNIAI